MTDKPSRNEDEYFVRQEAEILRQHRAEQLRSQSEAERRTHHMKCPKDGYDLASRVVHGVAIETCGHCGGMWLDAGELDAISRHEDHPGLLARIFGDVLGSLKPHHPGGTTGQPRRTDVG